MPKLDVKKSIVIDASAEKIFSIVSDFNHWTAWSPWLIMDPKAVVNVAPDSKYYDWNGERVGSGNMKVTKEAANEYVDYDLNFIKPFKSHAKVRFELKALDTNKTEVSWLMDSRLPFFMFFMKKAMTTFIGMDYERGLAMLKDYAQEGEVHSKLDFDGTSEFPGCTYVGIKTNTDIKSIGPAMEKDFDKLWGALTDHKDLVAGPPVAIYHKWDILKGKAAYTVGVPMKEVPHNLSEELITGQIPATKVYNIKHTGNYGHLGNAWSTMMNLDRGKVFKKNKQIAPFETYLNSPDEVSEKELITTVSFPVK